MTNGSQVVNHNINQISEYHILGGFLPDTLLLTVKKSLNP